MSDSLEFRFCIYVKDYIKIEKKSHEILEDNDDVQGVASNFEVDDTVMSSLTS